MLKFLIQEILGLLETLIKNQMIDHTVIEVVHLVEATAIEKSEETATVTVVDDPDHMIQEVVEVDLMIEMMHNNDHQDKISCKGEVILKIQECF